MEKLTEFLPCKLTEDELLQRGKALVTNINAENGLIEAKAAFAERHKEAIATLAGERRNLGQQIASGLETREVEVEHIPDYKRGTMAIVRMDSNTLVRERQLRPEERQADALLVVRGRKAKAETPAEGPG